MNTCITFAGVNWAGFPYPLPRRHHSPSYSTIYLINGDSPSSPVITTLSTELSALKFLGSPQFPVCRCFRSFDLGTSGVSHLPRDYPWLHQFTSCPCNKRAFSFFLSASASTPALHLLPCPLQQSPQPLDTEQQNDSGREHTFPLASARRASRTSVWHHDARTWVHFPIRPLVN